MPVISGESRYEALEISPEVTTRDVRQAFWAHLLNSGCAGHTYGANGVWQVNRENDPFGDSPSGSTWGSIPWRQAMQLPGSSQLALAKTLLLTLPWHRLSPIAPPPTLASSIRQKLLRWLPQAPARHQTPVAAADSVDHDCAIFYSIDSRPYRVDLSRLAQPVDAFWFDPVNGSTVPAIPLTSATKGRPTHVPPGQNAAGEEDWVLVVKTRAGHHCLSGHPLSSTATLAKSLRTNRVLQLVLKPVAVT